MKIAICDDEAEICSQLEKILSNLLKKRKVSYDIDVFYSGESLCRELEYQKYDLIFLDIELPGKSGVEIGKDIRENKRDDLVQIAYISSKQEYAMELFDVRPINFLIKPLRKEEAEKVIDVYMKIYGQKTDIFQYKKGYENYKVEVYKIMYFQRDGRKVIMHTIDETVEFYESLEKIYESVKNRGFLFIHKSYLVNYQYIKKIGYTHLVMTDGVELSISQSRRKEIRSQYMKLGEE